MNSASPLERLPMVHLSTEKIPQEHQLEVWQQTASPLFDVIPMKDMRSFSCSVTSYLVGQLTFNHTTFDRTQFIRTSRHLSIHGSDCITLQYYCSGQIQGNLESGVQLQMASDRISIHDFAHPYTGIGETSNQFAIVIPRHLITVHDQIYKNYPVFSWSVNSSVGRILTHAWLTIWKNLPDMSQADASAIAQGFIGLLNGLLSSKLDMATRAQVELSTIDAMKAHLQANLHLINLGVESLCEIFHCSRSTVYRLFKAEGGVQAYVREQRLKYCYQELQQLPPSSRKTISEIAGKWGFADAASFSRLFRKHYGISPSEVNASLSEAIAPVMKTQASYWSESDRLKQWLENYS